MKRREVIKKIGFSFGAVTITPSFLIVLNGCYFIEQEWQPNFFLIKSMK